MKLFSLIIAEAGILIARATLCMLTLVSLDEEDEENIDDDDDNDDDDNDNDSKNDKNDTVTLKKGPWTAEEDKILTAYVTAHGIGNWNIVRKNTGLARCGKSCRLRWINHLRGDLKRGPFSEEEKHRIIELHAQWGNKWAKMAQELPGRTDNEIKNYWNTRLKKLRRMGAPIYPDHIKPALKNIEIPEISLNGSDSQNAVTPASSNVPELVFHSYSQNHPLLEQPTNQLARINTILDSNWIDNIAPTAVNHERSEIYDISSLGMSQHPLTTNLPPFNSIYTSGSVPSSIPWLSFPSSDDNSLVTYTSIDTSGLYASHSVPPSSVLPGLHPFPLVNDDALPISVPTYHSINTSDITSMLPYRSIDTSYVYPSFPPSIPELPPLSSNDDNNILVHDELNLESLFNENAAPHTNGDLEAILHPPEVLEGSNHWPVQGEPSNPGNGQNLEVRDHANQEALGDFSCLENYDYNQNALEGLEAYLQYVQNDNQCDEIGDWILVKPMVPANPK